LRAAAKEKAVVNAQDAQVASEPLDAAGGLAIGEGEMIGVDWFWVTVMALCVIAFLIDRHGHEL